MTYILDIRVFWSLSLFIHITFFVPNHSVPPSRSPLPLPRPRPSLVFARLLVWYQLIFIMRRPFWAKRPYRPYFTLSFAFAPFPLVRPPPRSSLHLSFPFFLPSVLIFWCLNRPYPLNFTLSFAFSTHPFLLVPSPPCFLLPSSLSCFLLYSWSFFSPHSFSLFPSFSFLLLPLLRFISLFLSFFLPPVLLFWCLPFHLTPLRPLFIYFHVSFPLSPSSSLPSILSRFLSHLLFSSSCSASSSSSCQPLPLSRVPQE